MNDSPTSDSELLAAWVRHRDEAAFHALVERYARLVHLAARRTCGCDALAADASQLVFILLARKAATLTEHPSLAGWLHVAAVRTTRDLIDKSTREARKLQRFQTAMDLPEPAVDESWREIQPVLDEALGALPAKDREAVLLRYYRALSVREVAGVLGIATAAAQKRIDRATERLRGALLRRGCRSGGALGGVMLAGFASDAQAAIPAASLLAGKAIAAAPGVGVVSGATATVTSLMTKGTSILLPASVVIAGGIWWFLQHQTIARLERGNAALIAGLAVERPAELSGLTSKVVPTALEAEPIDWLEVARQLRESKPWNPVNPQARLEQQFAAMELQTVETSLDEVAAARLGEEDRERLEQRLCEELGGPKGGPWRVLDRFVGVIEEGSWKWRLGGHFKIWMDQDPDAAIAWLAKHVDAIPSLQFGFLDVSLHPLLATSPETAGRLLDAIPPERRLESLRSLENDEFSAAQQIGWAQVVRRHLPEADRFTAITWPTWNWSDGDGSPMDLPEITAYMETIEADREEREACLLMAAEQRMTEASRSDADLAAWVEEFRNWVAGHRPDLVDKATGILFSGRVALSPEAEDLVLGMHAKHGNDALLLPLLEYFDGENAIAPTARRFAERLNDGTLRQSYLEKLDHLEESN